jgi:hypothetical protein
VKKPKPYFKHSKRPSKCRARRTKTAPLELALPTVTGVALLALSKREIQEDLYLYFLSWSVFE